ncbi:MAG: c-type cytochrome [Janthinobacterium lividum]
MLKRFGKQFPTVVSRFLFYAGTGSILVFGSTLRIASSAHASVDPIRDGADLFATSGCTHCHGMAGEGTDRGPSLREVGKRRSSRQVSRQIREGGQVMPAFGNVLEDAQIQDLVMFLRAPAGLVSHAAGTSTP